MNIIAGNLDRIIAVSLLICTSIGLRILLQFVGQKWITTTAHTATLVLLPILTYVITNVISGNIALSLGMVGALSIVRFRNPVRSPLELSVYFGAITMGIAASVNLKWLVFLIVAVVLATLALIIMNVGSILILKRPFFSASFSEGNSLSTLEVKSNDSLPVLENSKQLTMKRASKEGFDYILASSNFSDLWKIQDELNGDKHVINYQLNK